MDIDITAKEDPTIHRGEVCEGTIRRKHMGMYGDKFQQLFMVTYYKPTGIVTKMVKEWRDVPVVPRKEPDIEEVAL